MIRVLVAGAARHLGNQLAFSLAQDSMVEHLVAVDITQPKDPIGSGEFVRADIRNPVLTRIMQDHGIDTVVHAGVLSTPLEQGGRSVMKEINVIGSMQLLAACRKVESIKHLVVKSTTALYGASAKDPAFFTESTPAGRLPSSGFAKDSADVESYVRTFARHRPDVSVTTLRFANVLGPRVSTTLTNYFELPIWPGILGYDPRLQFIHEEDLVKALHQSVLNPVAGTFNVAGEGAATLGQVAKIAGRPIAKFPPQLFSSTNGLLKRMGIVDLSREQLSLLKYGRVVDISRARDLLNFVPTHSSIDTFKSFASSRIRPLVSL